MHSINARKRRRLVRNTRQESNMEEGEAGEFWAEESQQSDPSINTTCRKITHFHRFNLLSCIKQIWKLLVLVKVTLE